MRAKSPKGRGKNWSSKEKMVTWRLLCELGRVITTRICAELWNFAVGNCYRIVWFMFPCKLSGAAAESAVPADSGWAGFSLLPGPGHRDRWYVPHPHQAGPEAFPQAGECFEKWLNSNLIYVFFNCTIKINVQTTISLLNPTSCSNWFSYRSWGLV